MTYIFIRVVTSFLWTGNRAEVGKEGFEKHSPCRNGRLTFALPQEALTGTQRWGFLVKRPPQMSIFSFNFVK